MNEPDLLAEIHAWREEFARKHGYDLSAMVASLRAFEQTMSERMVRGSPRRPTLTTVETRLHSSHPLGDDSTSRLPAAG